MIISRYSCQIVIIPFLLTSNCFISAICQYMLFIKFEISRSYSYWCSYSLCFADSAANRNSSCGDDGEMHLSCPVDTLVLANVYHGEWYFRSDTENCGFRNGSTIYRWNKQIVDQDFMNTVKNCVLQSAHCRIPVPADTGTPYKHDFVETLYICVPGKDLRINLTIYRKYIISTHGLNILMYICKHASAVIFFIPDASDGTSCQNTQKQQLRCCSVLEQIFH